MSKSQTEISIMTRKAHKMDALEANRRENLRVGQEYRWGDVKPYYLRQADSATRGRKNNIATSRRQRNVQFAYKWNDQDICDVYYDEADDIWKAQYATGRRSFRARCEAINYAKSLGYTICIA